MRLHIKQCTYCPRNSDCSHKDNLQKQARTILPNLHASHSCKEYVCLFKERDEVIVTINARDEQTFKYDKPFREDRGVIISASATTKGFFIVAFFEPVNIDSLDEEKSGDRIYNILPVRANQIKKIGEYSGKSFWDHLQHGNINDPTFA